MSITVTDSLIGACMKVLRQQSFYNSYAKTFTVIPAVTAALKQDAFRIRYQVYCEENHFLPPDPYPAELEYDAFDGHAIHHLLIHKPSGDAVGTVRVVLPDENRPLMSFELQKHCTHPLLHIENRMLGLCEISRFCMLPAFRHRLLDGHLLPSWYDQEDGIEDENGRSLFRRQIPYAPLGLLKAAFETATNHNIHNCLMMVETAQLKSFRRLGLVGRNLGVPINLHGQQQPLIFNIKGVLDNIAIANPACWDILTDEGHLQLRADELYRNDWAGVKV